MYKPSFWLHSLCGLAFCLGVSTMSVNPNAAYFIGPEYSYSKRDGFYDFPDVRTSQLRPRNSLTMFGATAGKRYEFNKFLRIQIGVSFEGGSVTDDTLLLTYTTSIKYSFLHASIEPELQFPLATAGRTRPYLMIGGGLNFLHVQERTFFLEDRQEVIYENMPYVSSGNFSLSGSAGFGFDYALTRSAIISLWYSFQYWQPVRYGIREDFPLQDQTYRETFFSNRFHLTLLFDIR